MSSLMEILIYKCLEDVSVLKRDKPDLKLEIIDTVILRFLETATAAMML